MVESLIPGFYAGFYSRGYTACPRIDGVQEQSSDLARPLWLPFELAPRVQRENR
jgi:hypothetical protein